MNFAEDLLEDLLEHPEKLSQWISEAIDSDDDYSVDEIGSIFANVPQKSQ